MELYRVKGDSSRKVIVKLEVDEPLKASTYATKPYVGKVSSLNLSFKSKGYIYNIFLDNEEINNLLASINDCIKKAWHEKKDGLK